MPTARRRHMITESDAVAAALDEAARRWPDDRDNRAVLLLRLLDEGHRAILGAAAAGRRRRVDAIRASGGLLTGCYGPDYLERLREEWPA